MKRPGPRGRPIDLPDASDAADWFRGRLPDDWFTDIEVISDRDEITVIGTLTPPEVDQANDPATAESRAEAAADGRAARFREDSRGERMGIAEEAQARYRRTVSWGVDVSGHRHMYTHIAVPVMTRLRQPERQVLDTLVDAGVARSRADALAWSVRLVGKNTDEWLAKLREAMTAVDTVRGEGPTV